MSRLLYFVACVAVTLAAQPFSTHAQDRCGIEPDSRTQRLLAEVFRPGPVTDETQIRGKLEELVRLVREDVPRAVQQVVLYEAIQKERAEPFGYGFAYSIFREANIAPEHYPDAISALLYCSDTGMRNEAWKLFRRGLTSGNTGGQYDLSHFRAHIAGVYQKADVAIPLKRALFEAAPTAAFFFYSGEWPTGEVERDNIVEYRRKLRIIDNALYEKNVLGGIPAGKVDDATLAAIRDLATSKYWWSRLFASEIIIQNKEFRDTELLMKILRDENELVRTSAASLDNPNTFRASPIDP